MTKREYEKYNKEVKDKYGNILKPGDVVAFPDSYYNTVHVGILLYFGEKTVIITDKYGMWKNETKVKRYPHTIVKIKDKDGNYTNL